MPAMHTLSLPLPGAARLRNVAPLTAGDGACPLLCDLERGTVVAVPTEFQLHVAQALETGDPDEALLGWLMSAGLWTAEEGSVERRTPRRRGRAEVMARFGGGTIRTSAELGRLAFEMAQRAVAADPASPYGPA
jgi:hypothetical protein